MQYWLMKSEPADVSVDDVLGMKDQTVAWYGVRNYLARNYMRDLMRVGDGVLFYHSNCVQPGIAGLAQVASTPYPDHTQFDKKSKYFDPKATLETPRWMMVDVQVITKIEVIGLDAMRSHDALADMVTLRKGNRLSITPVTAAEWRFVNQIAQKIAPLKTVKQKALKN